MSFQDLALQTAQSLGFDLIDIERSAGGLLRVTIDWPWQPGQPERFVQVEDCEKVTRQLQYALEVDGIDYRRLEVSSPGIDRPLTLPRHFGKNLNRLLKVTKTDGAVIVGRILSHTDNDVTLTVTEKKEAREITISLADIKRAQVEIEFNRKDGDK